jgi:cell division protein FtsI (penicillin-binding protein 3)
MAFGQEVGVTVLQMARAYAALANGGTLPVPHLVSAIRTPDGRIVRRASPQGRRVFSEQTAAIVRGYLTKVVESGTGRLSAIPGFAVAGKTGTAQKAVPGGGYAKDRFVASFIGFVPAEAPRLVIAVVIDEPKGKIYGGDVAAPIFSALGAEALQILREAPRELPGRVTPVLLQADLSLAHGATVGPLAGRDLIPVSQRSGSRGSVDMTRGQEGTPGEVPDLAGLSGRDAVRVLTRAGLVPRLSGSGFVVSQDPPAGGAFEPGAVCKVVLSLEPAPEKDEEGTS